MKVQTSITHIDKDGHPVIHGMALARLVRDHSFVESIFLILQGRLPEAPEQKMFDALLTAAIDHGPGTASGQTSRITASAKNSMHTSLAAGILAMGERHGSAIEPAMSFFYEHVHEDPAALIGMLKEQKVRIPGFGHAVLTHDHRKDMLYAVAKETGFYGKHCLFAESIFEALNKVSSKVLPMNVDGAMGSILCDMGFDIKLARGIFIIARMPGLVGQVYEEMTNDVGIRRMAEEDITYTP